MTKEISKQLYNELDTRLPGWRHQFPNIDAAVAAAKRLGSTAPALLVQCREQMKVREKRRPSTEPVKEKDIPVFDNGNAGRRCFAERRDEPGREVREPNAQEKEEGKKTKAAIGFKEDALFYPERPWTGTAFKWDPKPPARHSRTH